MQGGGYRFDPGKVHGEKFYENKDDTIGSYSIRGEKRNEAKRECEYNNTRGGKIIRAYGGCLGTERRRRTRQPAKRYGEQEACNDP